MLLNLSGVKYHLALAELALEDDLWLGEAWAVLCDEEADGGSICGVEVLAGNAPRLMVLDDVGGLD